jgi:hypothetical protein
MNAGETKNAQAASFDHACTTKPLLRTKGDVAYRMLQNFLPPLSATIFAMHLTACTIFHTVQEYLNHAQTNNTAT